MGDTLKYRIPNEDVVNKSGVFNPVSSFNQTNGFVISSFDTSEKFVFVESDEVPALHFNTEPPAIDSKASYLEKGNTMLEALKSEICDKAILSRVQQHFFAGDPSHFFDVLCTQYPNAFVYLVSSPAFGTWIGASPEVLIEGALGSYFTFALAGTRPSNSFVEWTNKEYDEQQFVTDFIAQSLQRNGASSIELTEVKTVNVGPVEHLRTDFNFKMHDGNRTNIIEALHPTPAVSGTPREAAMPLIADVEMHERSLYAGFIGVLGQKTNLFVNLRCAQLFENECYLYLGGGYTKDSDPEKEWIETENKAKTLLNIIEKL